MYSQLSEWYSGAKLMPSGRWWSAGTDARSRMTSTSSMTGPSFGAKVFFFFYKNLRFIFNCTCAFQTSRRAPCPSFRGACTSFRSASSCRRARCRAPSRANPDSSATTLRYAKRKYIENLRERLRRWRVGNLLDCCAQPVAYLIFWLCKYTAGAGDWARNCCLFCFWQSASDLIKIILPKGNYLIR